MDAMNQNVSAVSATVDRVVMHGLSTELSPIAGTAVFVVQGKKGVYDGFRCRVPALDVAEVAELLISDTAFAEAIIGVLDAERRAMLRTAERNGEFSLNQSLDAARISLEATAVYMATARASAVRLTKELVAKLSPFFRMAVASRWAEVKKVADTLSMEECMIASRNTQENYLRCLDVLRADGLLGEADARAVRTLLTMCGALDEVAADPELSGICDVALGKLELAERKRAQLTGSGQDVADLS